MAELSASKLSKDGYSFAGELIERTSHLTPAILNMPFDNTIYQIPNIFASPDYTSFSSWSGSGVYFQNRVLDNGTFGPFFGNGVYRCEKYGSATTFSYSINNITTFSVPTEYVAFTCIMKSSNSTSSYNPFSVAIIRGNKGGASNEYTTGELIWRRDEYLSDNFWRVAICLRLRADAVPTQYQNYYSFEVSANWADAGTYVWATGPMAYTGSEAFGYTPTATLSGDYITDPSGFIIDNPTTNYMDLATNPTAWDGGTISPVFWYKGVQAYKIVAGANGLGINYPINTSLTVSPGATVSFSMWMKKSTEVTLPISSVLLAGSIWSGAWSDKLDMSPYISLSSQEYFDDNLNKLSSLNKNFTWQLMTFKVTNTHTDNIRFSQVAYYNSLISRGFAYFAAPQVELGAQASWFTPTSRSTPGSLLIPCTLKAPYTVCFKYRPIIELNSIVDEATSPVIIQFGTSGSSSSLQLKNSLADLIVSGKSSAGTSFSQTLSTFDQNTWDYKEYLYTIIATDSSTFNIYMGSQLVGVINLPGAITAISSLSFGVSGFASGIYRDLVVLPRALDLTEIGDVGLSIKRAFSSIKNKDISLITAGREIKEPVNLLVSNWVTDPLYSTGVLDSTYSAYTQANCLVFLTKGSSGSGKYSYCVKRPAGILYAAQNMWGGVQLNLPENAKIEGRKYRFTYKYKGQTTRASEIPYLAYSVGWTSYGVGLTSQSISGSGIPANTNTKEWKVASGVYTVSNRWQKGTDNNLYDAYRQLKIGWGYEDTGSLGTKIFIDDIQIYDITNDDGLVAFYTASAEASYPTNTLWDASGNGYNCTTTNITITKDGPSNKLASYFNGASSKISNSTMVITPPCSISFWIKPKSLPTGVDSQVVLHTGTALGTSKGCWIATKASGVLSIGVPTAGGAPEYNTSASYLAVDTLSHIVINFSPDKTELYKNAVLTHTFPTGMSLTEDMGVVAGQNNGDKFYMGNLSDTRIYSRLLILTEIQALYTTLNVPTIGDFRVKKTGVHGIVVPDVSQVYVEGTAGPAGDITVSGATEVKWDGASLAPTSSTGLCLLIWNNKGEVQHRQVYNVTSVDADRTALVSKLNSIQGNMYWALTSYTSCGTNTALNAKMAAMNATQYATYDWSLYPSSPYAAFGYGQTCIKEELRTYGNDRWYATISLSL